MVHANIPSNAFNALNFIMFDLLFAAAITRLTSEMAGLFNCLSAFNRTDEDLALYKSPLVGSGITCTKRGVYYSLAALRILTWLLIFATTFFITGISIFGSKQIVADVTTLGEYGENQLSKVLMERAILRRGCQGRKDNFTYYGELRNKENCELDIDLLENPVKFGLSYEPTDINLEQCKKESRNTSEYTCDQSGVLSVYCSNSSLGSGAEKCRTYGRFPVVTCAKTMEAAKIATFNCPIDNKNTTLKSCTFSYEWVRTNYRCKNAVIGCYPRNVRKERVRRCRGTVNTSHGMYLCDNLTPENETQRTDCKRAEGIEWDREDWLAEIGESAVNSLDDAFAILYASGTETRPVKVKVKEGRQVTQISPVWFAILLFKIGIVLALVVVVLKLKSGKGLKPVANDENGIMKLLEAAMTQSTRSNLNDEEEEGAEGGVFVRMDGQEVRLSTSREG